MFFNDDHSKSTSKALFLFALFSMAAIAVAIVYAHVRELGFVYDDEYLIVKNPFLQDWKNALLFFARDVTEMSGVNVPSGYYRPMSMVLTQVLFHLFGLVAWKYHFFNLLLHTLNSFLAGVLVLRLGTSRFVAVATTLIFAVHPVHVESVTFICTYMGLSSSLLALSSILFFLKSRETGRSLEMFLSLACYALAILFKEDAIVLPMIFLIFDGLFFKKRIRDVLTKSFVDILPFFVTTAFYLTARGFFVSQDAAFGFWQQAEQLNFSSPGGWVGWIGTLLLVFKSYFALWIWPNPLTIFHFLNFPSNLMSWIRLGGEWSLIAWVMIRSSQNRTVMLGWIWFFGFSFLISNVIPIGGMFSERLIYLPSVGLAWMTAIAAKYLWNVFKSFHLLRWLLRVAMAGVIGLWGFQAHAYSLTWKSNFSIWWHAAEVEPYQSYPYWQLARLYSAVKNPLAAAGFYKKAVLFTREGASSTNMRRSAAQAFGEAGEYDLAIREYKALLQNDPQSWGGYFDLGWTYLLKGDLVSAEATFHELLEKNPDWGWGYLGLAEIEVKRGHIDLAKKLYVDALNHAPDSAMVKIVVGKFQEISKS